MTTFYFATPPFSFYFRGQFYVLHHGAFTSIGVESGSSSFVLDAWNEYSLFYEDVNACHDCGSYALLYYMAITMSEGRLCINKGGRTKSE